MRIQHINILVAFILLGSVVLTSCKRYYDPPLVFENTPEPVIKKERKILFLVIDGLPGLELKKSVPTNINSLLANSKYTFEGFADGDTGDAATWTTLVSGKNTSGHGIHGNSFIEDDIDEDDPHGHDDDGSGFTTVFQRLLQTGKKMRSLTVTSYAELDEYLYGFSDNRVVTNSDLATKDSLVSRLNKQRDLSFIVANFRSLNEAGVSGGFSVDNANFVSTLNTIDEYIGHIITALHSRENYSHEDWLVVLTSNHGGLGDSYGGGTMEERKIPIIFYHPKINETQFTVPPSTTGFKASSGSFASMTSAEAQNYNIGTSGEYTIQLKMMVHQEGANNAAIISKQNNTGNSTNGWSFIHNGPSDGWRLKVFGTQLTSNKTFKIGEWYTLTARIYMDGNTRKAQVFTDGDLGADGNLGTAQGSSTENLNVGYSTAWSNGSAIHTIRDLRVYNKAIPVDHITSTYCQTIGYEEDPYKENLIGYWNLSEGIGRFLNNRVDGAPKFTIGGTPAWDFLSENFCRVPIEEEEQNNEKFLYSTDILPSMFYWLGITPHASWKLDGKDILNLYEEEFLTF